MRSFVISSQGFPYVLLAKKNRTLEVVPAETVTGARALQNKGSKTSPEQSYILHVQVHAKLIPTVPKLQRATMISSRRFPMVKNPRVRRVTLVMLALPTAMLANLVVDPIDLEPKDFEEKGKEREIVEISSDEGENQLYTE